MNLENRYKHVPCYTVVTTMASGVVVYEKPFCTGFYGHSWSFKLDGHRREYTCQRCHVILRLTKYNGMTVTEVLTPTKEEV